MIRSLRIAVLAAILLVPAGAGAQLCGINPVRAAPAPIEIAFSPSDGATDLVVRTVKSAHSRVASTSSACAMGFDVNKSNATALCGGDVPRKPRSAGARGLSLCDHDKFIVVDGQVVETGSFNFTATAESRNAENVVVLHDPVVAQQYGREWERLWSESEYLKARYYRDF